MRCERFDDAGAFLDAVGTFLTEHEAENTVLAGVALRCRSEPRADAPMLAVRDGEAVRLAALMTPPFNLVLSAGDPAAIPCLAAALLEAGVRPPGVDGPKRMAEAFAAFWGAQLGIATETGRDVVLYRATAVAPRAAPGELRTAAAADTAWLTAWQTRFATDAGLSPAEAADAGARTASRIARGELVFWAADGRPVSMAAFVPTTATGDAGRINAVFTPAEERRRGYASACVAALSLRLLAGGWRYCLIFADARNPITNRIYPRLGYRRLGVYRNIAFR